MIKLVKTQCVFFVCMLIVIIDVSNLVQPVIQIIFNDIRKEKTKLKTVLKFITLLIITL